MATRNHQHTDKWWEFGAGVPREKLHESDHVMGLPNDSELGASLSCPVASPQLTTRLFRRQFIDESGLMAVIHHKPNMKCIVPSPRS